MTSNRIFVNVQPAGEPRLFFNFATRPDFVIGVQLLASDLCKFEELLTLSGVRISDVKSDNPIEERFCTLVFQLLIADP